MAAESVEMSDLQDLFKYVVMLRCCTESLISIQKQADDSRINEDNRVKLNAMCDDWESTLSRTLGLSERKITSLYRDIMLIAKSSGVVDQRIDNVQQYLAQHNADTITVFAFEDLNRTVKDIKQLSEDELRAINTEYKDKVKTLKYNHAQQLDHLRISNEKEVMKLKNDYTLLETTSNGKQMHIEVLDRVIEGLYRNHDELLAQIRQLEQRLETLDRTRQDEQTAIQSIEIDRERKISALEATNKEQDTRIKTLESANAEQIQHIKALESTISQQKDLIEQIHSLSLDQKQQIDILYSDEKKYKERLASLETSYASDKQHIESLRIDNIYYRDEVMRLEDELYTVGQHGSTLGNKLAWIGNRRDLFDLLHKIEKLNNHREHWNNQAKTAPQKQDRMEARRRSWVIDGYMRRVKECHEQLMVAMKAAASKTTLLTEYEAGTSTRTAEVVTSSQRTSDDVPRPDDHSTEVISSNQEKVTREAIFKYLSEHGVRIATKTAGVEEGDGESNDSEPVHVESTVNDELEQNTQEPGSSKRSASPARENSPKRLKSATVQERQPLSPDEVKVLKDMNICLLYHEDSCVRSYCIHLHMDRRFVDDLLDI